MSQYDRHLTTEQLSAFLDRQVSSQEQLWQDAHLKICEQCQHKLAELRHTVGLLRALPQPPLPRSFLLPTSEAITTSIVAQADGIAQSNESTHRRGWPHSVRTTIRVISTLAAVVGIVFLLSGLLSMVSYTETTTSMPAASSSHLQGNANTPTNHFAATPSVYRDLSPTATTHQEQGSSGNATPSGPSQPPLPNLLIPSLLFIFLNTAGGRVELGLLLFALSIVGFILLNHQSKRTTER